MRKSILTAVGLGEASGGQHVLREERERGDDHEQEHGQGYRGENHGGRPVWDECLCSSALATNYAPSLFMHASCWLCVTVVQRMTSACDSVAAAQVQLDRHA